MPKSKRLEAASVPSHLRMQADLETATACEIEAAKDGDKELTTFRGTAYTGVPMRLAEFYRPVIVDLDGVKVRAGAHPILLNHRRDRILGHSESIEVGKHIKVAGVFSSPSRHAKRVIKAGKNGFPWQMSIGADIEKMVYLDDGETADVNGRKYTGPLLIARKTSLEEISFVPLGADRGSSARVAATASQLEVIAMTFEAWLAAKGFDEPDKLSDEQCKSLQAMYDAEQAKPKDEDSPPHNEDGDGDGKKKIKAAAKPADEAKDDSASVDTGAIVANFRSELAAESKRVAEIRKICAGKHPEIEAKAIEEGTEPVHVEVEILRKGREDSPSMTAGYQPDEGAALECAMCQSAGVSEKRLEKWYPEKVIDAATDRKLRGAGIHSLLYHTIHAAGKSVRIGVVDNDVIRTAFEADRQLRASGFSTVSLSGILGAVAYKSLMASFLAVDQVAQRICSETDVSNFHTHTRYRLVQKGEFLEVGADGEIKHGEFDETSYTNKIATYGQMIGLNRQQIINDDLGAFAQIPRLLGRKAALALQKAVFTLVLANTGDFFAAANSNYISGADTVLQITSLTTAEQTFMDQTDEAGDPVVISPAILLVPTALKVTGQQLYSETRVNELTTANKPKPANNPHAGKWRVECSPYLSNSNLTGYSSTAWYLLANPADIACWEIAYLRGQRTPTIESDDADFHQLGMQYRAYWDFGVAQVEKRAGVMSLGAAAE